MKYRHLDSEEDGLGSWGLELGMSKLKNLHLSTNRLGVLVGKVGEDRERKCIRRMVRLGSGGQMPLCK